MTGAEHYRAAERILSEASFIHSPDDPQPITRHGHEIRHDVHQGMLARAQVHATLALAAASAMPVVHQMMGDDNQVTAWGKAIGWSPVVGQVETAVALPDPERRAAS